MIQGNVDKRKSVEALERLFSDSSNTEYPFTDEFAEAVNAGINALNKQIPNKPQKVLSLTGKTVFECMNCGNELEVNNFNGQYCHWCGQKLDWSDVD